MQQTTVYQTVSVQDEMPTEAGWYVCHYGAGMRKFLWYDSDAKIFMHDKKYDELFTTHWEKPATGYFFTPEEFREVLIKAGEAAVSGKGTFEDFYNQLTESK